MRKNKKKVLAGVLAVLLAFVAVGGTIAWLTVSASIDNTFIVGGINPPTDEDDDDKNEPDDKRPDDNDDIKDDENPNLEGNLYENFKQNSPAAPGATVTKTPYVVIGPESESAYVFVYVDNKTLTTSNPAKDACFVLNENWKPVSGHVTQSTATADGVVAYTKGLFAYTGTSSDAPTAIGGKTVMANTWTKQVFDNVTFPSTIEAEDFAEDPAMTVSCFIYASDNTTASQATADAITWANGLSSAQGE